MICLHRGAIRAAFARDRSAIRSPCGVQQARARAVTGWGGGRLASGERSEQAESRLGPKPGRPAVTTADPLDLDTFCASGPAQRVIELGGYSDDGVSALAQSQLASFTKTAAAAGTLAKELPAVWYQFPV